MWLNFSLRLVCKCFASACLLAFSQLFCVQLSLGADFFRGSVPDSNPSGLQCFTPCPCLSRSSVPCISRKSIRITRTKRSPFARELCSAYFNGEDYISFHWCIDSTRKEGSNEIWTSFLLYTVAFQIYGSVCICYELMLHFFSNHGIPERMNSFP